MLPIVRYGVGARWSEIVVYNHVATWVEVADDASLDTAGQISQILDQIDLTLAKLGIDRTHLLTVTIYLADLAEAPILNRLWDAWIAPGHAPVRACVAAGLSGTLKAEMIVTAAVP